MARPKRSDPHLRMAHSINEQIMIRQFTAKQRRACDLILRLSWGCGKETAYIPHLSFFEVVGLYKQDAHPTIALLVAENVLYWDKQTSHFAFNKDFDQWKVSLYLSGVARQELLPKLIKTNLSKDCPSVSESLTHQLVNHLPPSKYITDAPVSISLTPLATKSKLVNKRKEKEIKGNKISTTTTEPFCTSKNFGDFCRIYEQNIGMLSPILAQELDLLATDFSLVWFEEAVKEAVTCNKRALKYIAAILERWGREGYKAPMGRKTGMPPGRPPKAQLPTAEELKSSWGKKGSTSDGNNR